MSTNTQAWQCLPVTTGVRTRLLTVLAAAYPNPLATTEIQQRLRQTFGCNHTYRRQHDDPQYIPDWLPNGCNGGEACPGQCWYTQAYPQLRRLAKLGLIEWHTARTGGVQAAWRLADPDKDEDQLESASCPTPVGIVDLDTPARRRRRGR